MCKFAVDLIDFDKLSDSQKKDLLKDLQKRREALQEQLEGVSEALTSVEKKSKRP